MTTPDMHAALARLVNNEMTRKQEKIDPIPKRSSREAELLLGAKNIHEWLSGL